MRSQLVSVDWKLIKFIDRIWELSNKRKSKSIIVVKSKERGGRTKITCCAWSLDGKQIAGACEDGSLHIWNASSNFARPNVVCSCFFEDLFWC